MIYRSYTPTPPLAEFVERFWQCSDTPSHRCVRVLPSGTIELVINLREDEIRIYDALNPDCITRFSGAVVSGPYSGRLMIDPIEHVTIIGVHFKPGGAFPFLSAPADELTNRHVDLENLWGRTAAELAIGFVPPRRPTSGFRFWKKRLSPACDTRRTGTARYPSRLRPLTEWAGYQRFMKCRAGLASASGDSSRCSLPKWV